MNSGKANRWNHIFRDDGKSVIVAMDHSQSGRSAELTDYLSVVRKVAAGGADAILLSYGNLIQHAGKFPRNLGLIVSVPRPPRPEIAKQVLLAGGDGLKFTHFGSLQDPNLQAIQPISAACEEYGLVFMPEVVPQDEKRNTIYNEVVYAARLGQEAGGDFIKTAYTGSPESFKKVVANCPIPIVILGGPKMETDEDLLKVVKGAMDGGGAGTSIGRNVFQHKDPQAITAAFCKIVHEGASVKDALKVLK
ncbi:MAG: Fructose-bisphosphate aldolase [Thermoproteota archaeon]|nr:Fructose-bisphosphate aldolase [Thermoproteota archaeon]